MSNILDDFTQKIIAFRDERNWQQFQNPKDSALSLVLEAAEVMEHMQWRNGEDLNTYLAAHKEDVADELSDVLYWVLLMAHDLDIDLATAFPNKLAKTALKYPIDKAFGNHTKHTEL